MYCNLLTHHFKWNKSQHMKLKFTIQQISWIDNSSYNWSSNKIYLPWHSHVKLVYYNKLVIQIPKVQCDTPKCERWNWTQQKNLI
jgi:hypothetical protein